MVGRDTLETGVSSTSRKSLSAEVGAASETRKLYVTEEAIRASVLSPSGNAKGKGLAVLLHAPAQNVGLLDLHDSPQDLET